MADKEVKRLRPKYRVTKISEGLSSVKPAVAMLSTDPDNIDSPFVLMPRKDPAAFHAMLTYAALCEPRLADEIHAWLRKIARAAPKYGTQGERNRVVIYNQAIARSMG
jgi:hypothetical protein